MEIWAGERWRTHHPRGSSPQCPITCSTDAVPSSPSHSDAANPITMTTETSRRLASYQATSRKDRRNTLDLWTATKISIENHYIPLYYIILSVMLKRNLNRSSGQMTTRDWLGNFQTSKHFHRPWHLYSAQFTICHHQTSWFAARILRDGWHFILY
jgi:hypothetical protein